LLLLHARKLLLPVSHTPLWHFSLSLRSSLLSSAALFVFFCVFLCLFLVLGF
jgi:hypothetical protein